jgi:hypothetical protein
VGSFSSCFPGCGFFEDEEDIASALRMPSFSAEIVKDGLCRIVEHWYVLHNGFPNHLVVNAKVVMNQLVSHAGNIAPVHFGVSCPNGARNLFRCFTDDFKASDKGSLQVLVVQEILIRDRPGTLYEVDALIEDIFSGI